MAKNMKQKAEDALLKKAKPPIANSMGQVAITKPERRDVTERGVDLLQRLAVERGMYLTQAEAGDIVTAGDAEANFDDKDQFGNPCVILTEQGRAKTTPVQFSETKRKVTKMSQFEIEDYSPAKAPRKRGGSGERGSKYPFDALKVGQSFHVPVSEAMPEPVKSLGSAVVVARRKYGKPFFDADSKPVMVTRKNRKGETVTSQKLVFDRDFYVVAAEANDPKGPGARVVRSR